MPDTSTYILDLRDIVRTLVTELAEPTEIWLFGSRAQQTGSKRSDVDLLLIDPDGILLHASLVEWLQADEEQRSPLDIFLSRDGRIADSVVNGSVLRSQASVAEMVGGLLLWSRAAGMAEDPALPWLQEFRKGVTYAMSVIPTNFSSTLRQLPGELDRLGLPNTLLGTDWGTVARRCADILAAAADATTRLQVRAPNLNRVSAYPRNEYDAQNLFFLALRPWLMDLEINPFLIRYAGQEKSADLGAARSSLIIEVKFVSDAGTSAAIIKQLSGLAGLYAQPGHVKAVIFAIVVTCDANWDSVKIDHDFSDLGRLPIVLTRSIRLPQPP